MRRKRKKNHTSYTAHLRTPPFPLFPKKSHLSSHSAVVPLPSSTSPSVDLRKDHLDIIDDAAVLVSAVTRASNLCLVFAKSLKRTEYLHCQFLLRVGFPLAFQNVSLSWRSYHLTSWILVRKLLTPLLVPAPTCERRRGTFWRC